LVFIPALLFVNQVFMSSNQADVPEPSFLRWRPWLPSILTLSGFLPLLLWHVGHLLERPHYQFVLLLPVAFWLLITSLPEGSPRTYRKVDQWTAALILLVAFGGLAVATFFWSPWLAAVAFLLAAFATLLFWGGRGLLQQWLPVWAFSLILIPLPFGLDEDLIVRLRNLTTQLSSLVLDQFGVLHQAYANIIELPGKSLFIADACSGIHSLYVLTAVAMFVAAWHRRSLIHILCLLTSTFFLVLVENIARIILVAVAWTKATDLSVGTPHTILGILLFGLSAGLVFSIDQFLQFFLPENFVALFKKAWNAAEGINDRLDERKKAKSIVAVLPNHLPRLWVAFACIFPFLGLTQLFQMPGTPPQVLAAFEASLELPKFGSDGLPTSLLGFEQENFEIIRRVEGDPFGLESQQWTYRKGNLKAAVYLDYPYTQTHDLCECYSQIGWRIIDPGVLKAGTAVIGNQPLTLGESVAKAKLSRDFYGDAFILFSQFDLSDNRIAVVKVEIRGSVEDRITRRWNANQQESLPDNVPNPVKPPYVQIQLFASGLDPEIQDQQMVELVALYEVARNELRAKVLEAASSKQLPGVNP
jgi:exosortase